MNGVHDRKVRIFFYVCRTEPKFRFNYVIDRCIENGSKLDSFNLI
jgi:hypothetical protein